MSFLNLPAEVRQRVYSYTFGHGVAEALAYSNQAYVVIGFKPDQRSAQILSVSKGIAAEATAIFSEQTIVVLGRHFTATDYLSDRVHYMLGPRPDGIRHLNIDFHPNDVENIDVRDIAYLELPNIKDINLSCFALCWTSMYPTFIVGDTVYSYDGSVIWLRKLALEFLASTNLSLMEEKSVIGKKVVIELSSVRGELLDT